VEKRGVGGNNKSNNSKVYLNQEKRRERNGEGEKGVKRQKRKKRRVTHNFFLHMTFCGGVLKNVHSNRTSIMKLEKGCQ
jgi:hypothetical protein